jgi:hypothetical protein
MDEYAAHSGRSQCTLLDLQNTLQTMNIDSAELTTFWQNNRHIGPIPCDLERLSSTEIIDDTVPLPLHQHLNNNVMDALPPMCPSHMPPFPARHAYKQTAVYQYREQDAGKVRELSTRQNRRLQENLKQLVRKTNHTLVEIFSHSADYQQLPIINYE